MIADRVCEYLLFANGGAALFLAAAAFVRVRLTGVRHPLLPLGVFAAMLAAAACLRVLSALSDRLAGASAAEPYVIAAAVVALAALPRRAFVPEGGRWPDLLSAALVAAAVALGAIALRVLFAATAACAAGALLRPRNRAEGGSPPESTRTIGACLFVQAAIAAAGAWSGRGLPGNAAGLLPWALGVVSLFACAASLLWRPARVRTPTAAPSLWPLRLLVLLMGASLIAGMPVYVRRARQAYRALEARERQALGEALRAIGDQIGRADSLARLIASETAVVSLLESGGAAGREAAHRTVDHYGGVLPGSVAYLMDDRGTVVASSDRLRPESLVGQSFQLQPHFVDAAVGYQGRYLALRPTTHARTCHTAAIVRSAAGRFVGVAALECDVGLWRLHAEGPLVVVLVDPNGVIFHSNRDDLLLSGLWPVSGGAGRSRAETRQFGPGPFAPVLPLEPRNGEVVSLHGCRHLVLRAPTVLPGWSVFVLGSTEETNSRLLSALAVVLAWCVGLLGLLAVQHVSAESVARIALSESRYRAVVDGAPLWISVLDEAGRIVVANPAGRQAWTGAASPGQELIGARFESLWPDQVRPAVETSLRAASGGQPATVELSVAGRSGQTVVWSLSLVPVMPSGSERSAVLVIGEEVTARRLAQNMTLLTERLAAVGTLAAGVAHRFNNIHAAVQAYLEALARHDALAADPGAASKVRAARDLLAQASQIVERLLSLSHPAGSPKTPQRLGAVAEAVVSLLDDSFRDNGIALEARLGDDPPVLVNTDGIRFVVMSLLSNARDAVAGRDLRRITVRTGARETMALLEVGDSGPGLSPDAGAQLFNPFYTRKGEWAEPGSSLTHARGLGLSLSVCHAIVREHGGTIESGAGPDGGALFTVLLPLAPAPTISPSARAPAATCP